MHLPANITFGAYREVGSVSIVEAMIPFVFSQVLSAISVYCKIADRPAQVGQNLSPWQVGQTWVPEQIGHFPNPLHSGQVWIN